jgi:hypothetical protein
MIGSAATSGLPAKTRRIDDEIGLSNPLNQPGTFDRHWTLGATSGAAVVPNPYRLQACNADDTTTLRTTRCSMGQV